MIRAADFRDPAVARQLLRCISDTVAASPRPLTLMEVCGTHTMAIHQHGIRSLLPGQIRLVSGPGCPVCVTPVRFVDHAVALSRQPGTIIATFGDMMRVPGSSSSLLEEKARGGDIRIVYSPLEAVGLAENNPAQEVVFLGVGFETTTPTVAGAILQAGSRHLENFSVLCAHKTMPAPMEALSADPELQVDGYICPAHVSAITGPQAYLPLAEQHHVACVITGFEPLDILQGVAMLAGQIMAGEAKVENQYRRFVAPDGNSKAQQLTAMIFEPCDALWRGIGLIPGSGLRLRERFAGFDAARKFDISVEESLEPPGCRCGEILKGKIGPRDCPLFGSLCTPESPVGACMVSSEGTCAAEHKYGC